MIGIAVVASAHDAKFAEEVRAGLQAAGLDASVSQSLPKAAGPHVVLIWSAALEADHAIDAQALIGLWSEDRLVTVRRDETPLPLGLRDLPSLPPGSTAEEVCAAVPGARYTTAGPSAEVEQVLVGSMAEAATTGTGPTGSQEVELEFWRAIKDGNDPDDFELYVQQFPTGIYVALAKRKLAKLRGTAPGDANAAELEKRELEEAAKREAGVKQKLAEEKADLGALLAARAEVARAEVARPEADLKKKLAEAPREKMSIGVVIGALVAIVIVGGGGWYYFNKSSLEKQAALTAALESATKASQELQQAQAMQQESLKVLEEARAKEIAALKSGDSATIKEAQEAAKRAEAEAAKQAEAVKQSEAGASDARKKATEAAENAKKASKGPEQKAPEPVAKAEPPTAKTRSEREPEEEDRLASQAALKKGVPVAAAPAATTPAEAQATSAPEPKTEVAAVPVAVPSREEAAKAAAQVAEAPERATAKSARPMTRSEREREEEDRQAGQAALRRGPQVAASAPAPASAPASAASSPTQQAADLFEQAQAMEASDPRGALKIYRSLARGGNGKAAKRLGEIYDKGIVGVSRDYAESLQWYETARQLGETVETAGRREGGPTVAPSPAPAPAKPAAKERALEAPKAAPAPPPATAALPEAAKAATPAPSPLPAPEAKPAAEPAAPAHETKTGWFTWRGLLIAIFVLALIAWRRSRRRQKAEARQAQRASAAANRKDAADLAAARPAQRPQAAAQQAARGDATLFVSYSHKDRDRVEPVVSVIEEMGRRVWMDRSDITGQTGWAGQIVRAIRECRAVVLMASPNSYTSDQVVRELYLAMNHRKTIVPIEIEPAEMPDELQYILAPFQHHRLSGRETREVLGRALAAV